MPDLTQEEARWRVALQAAAFGIWDLDPRSETVQYTPQWKARFGFARIDSPDSTSFWRSRVHPDDFNPMLRALRLHLDGYTPMYEMRFRLRGGDFRYLPVLSRGRVVERDGRGDALRMVGTMVDLARRWPGAAARVAPAVHLPAGLPAPELLARDLPTHVGDLLDMAVRDASD
jgi:PAS domain-containing protein